MKKLKKTTAMESAALALLRSRSYCMGNPDDRFIFGGRYEAGCELLKDGGLAETHPKGLQTFAHRRWTLTSPAACVFKQAYRLTLAGKAFAENLKKTRDIQFPIEPCP